MGKLFWIGSGVGLVAAVGLWAGMTMPVQGEVASLHSEVKTKRGELIKWATPGDGKNQKFDDIVNPSFIKVEKDYKRGLAEAEGKLLEQMRARNMDLGPAVWDPPPPMHEVAAFRDWLTAGYVKRNEKLRKAEVVVPDDAVSLGEVPNWDDVGKEDLPRILREFRVSCEVFGALAEASAKIRYRAKVKNEKGEMEVFETEKDEVKKVVEIEGLRFEEAEDPKDRRRGRGRPSAAREKSSLFKEHTFTVKFNAHHGVAVDFIRRLEESKAGIFAVRTAEVGRVDRLDLRAGSDDDKGPYANALRAEGPSAVEVTASLLEFTKQDKKEAE